MQHKSNKERIAPRLNAVCGDNLCDRHILKGSCWVIFAIADIIRAIEKNRF